MDASYDLVIRNARLRGHPDELMAIGVTGDRIARIGSGSFRGAQEIDADGNLVIESFVDAHLHMCKVYTLEGVGDEAVRAYTSGAMGSSMTAIELASAVKERYDESWIYPNARRALLEGLRHGVTHVQAFADTDVQARLHGVKALLRLRDEFSGIVDLRVVAFPQDGVVRDAGAADYVRVALELGADVVGGIPWIEYTDRDAGEHIAQMLDLAIEFDRDVAMLVDDAGDPSLRTTEMLAAAAIERGLQGRVVACHARAMGHYPEPYLRRLIGLAQRAGMRFVTDPHTGALHLPVFDLVRAKLPVALGQDDIADAYYPYGQHNLLEVAFIASHILGASGFTDMDVLLDMVTTRAADVLGMRDHRLREGSPADLVVLDGASTWEALRRHNPPPYVVRGGRVVVENSSSSKFYGVPSA